MTGGESHDDLFHAGIQAEAHSRGGYPRKAAELIILKTWPALPN